LHIVETARACCPCIQHKRNRSKNDKNTDKNDNFALSLKKYAILKTEREVKGMTCMRNRKYFWAGAVIFYMWYVYTCAVFQFADWYASGMLYRVLVAFAPLTWLGAEGASACLTVWAPIVFFAATVIFALLSEFTKRQKIVLAVMPVVSYALFWVMECIPKPVYIL